MGIASDIESGVASTIHTYVIGYSDALATSVRPIALTGIAIYVFMIGWSIARGDAGNPMSTILLKFFRIALVTGIAFGGYQSIVYQGMEGIEGVFSGALGGHDSVGDLIDKGTASVDKVTDELFAKATKDFWPDWRLLSAAVLCALGQIILVTAALVPLLTAKVMFALLIAIGPVFIMMAIWPGTQRYAESWLNTTLATCISLALLTVIVGFVPTYVDIYAKKVHDNINSSNALQDAISLAIVVCVLAWVAWNSSQFAASLTSGGALGNPLSTATSLLMSYMIFGRRGGGEGSGNGAGNSPNGGAGGSISDRSPRMSTRLSEGAGYAAGRVAGAVKNWGRRG